MEIKKLVCKLPDKNSLLITHTGVNDSLWGRVGKRLVSATVNYARQKGYVVKATCSCGKTLLDNLRVCRCLHC